MKKGQSDTRTGVKRYKGRTQVEQVSFAVAARAEDDKGCDPAAIDEKKDRERDYNQITLWPWC